MNQGCHGAAVEMHGMPSISHRADTGLVVSGVDATTMSWTSSSTISWRATSAARLGLDWLSRTMISYLTGPLAVSMVSPRVALTWLMTKSSASAKAASGPVCGVT